MSAFLSSAVPGIVLSNMASGMQKVRFTRYWNGVILTFIKKRYIMKMSFAAFSHEYEFTLYMF